MQAFARTVVEPFLILFVKGVLFPRVSKASLEQKGFCYTWEGAHFRRYPTCGSSLLLLAPVAVCSAAERSALDQYDRTNRERGSALASDGCHTHNIYMQLSWGTCKRCNQLHTRTARTGPWGRARTYSAKPPGPDRGKTLVPCFHMDS